MEKPKEVEEAEREKEEIHNREECVVRRLLDRGNTADDPESGWNSFAGNTAVFLLGLGLKPSEVELFEKHGLGTNQILTLSENDLIHIGIICPKERQALLDMLDKFRHLHRTPPENMYLKTEDRPDCEKVLVNTSKHLQTLTKTLPYLRHRMGSVNGDCFFSNGVSGAYTLDLILELCLQQAKETQEQLIALAQDLDKDEEDKIGKSRKKFGHKKLLLIIMLTGSCASLAMWGLRSVGPGFWSFRWPTLLFK